jgi:RHS repeat-associated protein
MNSYTHYYRYIARIVCSLTLALTVWTSIMAQQTDTDGTTPLGLSPGAPVGSYPLSDFDNVNLFNGNLNFSMPLAKIGGRGSATYPITLRIDQKWQVRKEPYDGQPPINYYYAQPGWWTDLGWSPVYSMGRMEVRQGGSRTYVIGPGCGYVHQTTLTRLTFSAPDGTEFELRDQATNGQPAPAMCTNYNRGTVFVTADGSAATFISDADITDYPYDNPADISVSGYLTLRDGTRYRIVNGDVSWIRDRNGNKLTLTYDMFHRVTSVTDSMNRVVTVSYNSGPGSYDLITLKGFGGATRTIKVYFDYLSNKLRSDQTFKTVAQLFPELNGGGGYLNTMVVSAIELPNGKQYQFQYDSYSELARVILPTGGAIEYDYNSGVTDSTSGVISGLAEKHIYRRLVERRVYPDGSSGSGFTSRMTYSRPESTSSNLGYVTTDQYNSGGTMLARTIHYFNGSARASFFKQPTEYPAWTDSREYKTETYAANGTTMLRKVEYNFAQRAAVSWWGGGAATAPPNDTRPTDVITTLSDTNQVSKQTFGYDDSVPFNNQNNLKEYDFGSGAAGALLRETRTTFVTSSTYTGTNVHIRNLPSQVSIYDGGGVERSRTTYEYDNYATDTNHAGLVDRAFISGLDSAFTTLYTTRGNATGTTVYYLSGGSVTGSASSYSQFDIAGNVVKNIDRRGNATTMIYADCFGTPNGEARTNIAPTELGTLSSFGFLTKTINAANHTTYTQFDFYLGKPVDGEDANGVVTSGYYSDSLDRPTQIIRAVGTGLVNQTSFSYDDTNRFVTTTSDLDGTNQTVSRIVYDQMGRQSEKQQFEGGTNYITTQTQYDVLGRAYKTSNPFRPWQGETASWTTTAFDELGRPTTVTATDNAVTTSSYSGNSVTVTDPATKKRKAVSDALGRLTQVYEDPTPGSNLLTSYSYDVLDDLTTVTQDSQTRTFNFNSLKQLTSSTNPETGTMSYQYDNGGNVLVKTDARGVSTHYEYDVLGRVTRRWYNGSNSTSSTSHGVPALPSGVGITNEASYFYDAQTLPPTAPSYSRGSSIGKRVAVTYGTGATTGEYYGFDALGRSVLKIQRTDFLSYQMSASYNFAGSMTSLTYPSGHTVNYTYDAAGRASTFGGNLGDGSSRTYASSISYSPFGSLSREQFGTTTPLYHKSFYNIRGQFFDTRLSSVDDVWDWNRGRLILYYSSSHAWGQGGTDNNGNVRFSETWIPPENATIDQADMLILDSYNYDAFNRLSSVTEDRMSVATGWGTWQQQFRQQYAYDNYGNRTINTGQTFGTGVNNTPFNVNTATNQLTVPSGQSGSMTYDQSGNLTNDTYTGAGNRTYDGENKITSAWGGNGQAQTYAYDGSGQRIKRTVNGVQTWEVYGFHDELLADYAANGLPASPQKEYGYRNGQLLVTAEPSAAQQSTQNVVWTNAAGVSVSGNNLTKNTTDGWANSGASSTQAIVSGDGYVQLTATETNTWRMIGLSNGDSNKDYTDIDFAAYLSVSGSNLCIYEAGVSRGCPSTYTTGDTIKVAVESGVVKYRKNGAVVYTSTVAPSYPLLVDSALYSNGSTLNSVVISGLISGGVPGNTQNVSWTNATGVSVSGNNLTKAQVDTWGNSGASSTQSIASGDGYVELTATEINTWRMIGLSHGDANQDYTDIDFAAYLAVSGNNLCIYEAGVNRGCPSTYNTGDTIRVAVESGVVKYKKNGAVVYTSTVAPSYPLLVDTALYSNGATLNNVVISGNLSGGGGSGTGGVRWLVTDHLGSPRMIVDQTGTLASVRRHDYLPFGEELFAPAGGRDSAHGYAGGDGVRQQFTGYERDIETGLDYAKARSFGSMAGRFTSPDPLLASAKPALPQSWNRYTYVMNNPLKFVDPSGMIWMVRDIDKRHRGYAWFDGTEKQAQKAWGKSYKAVQFGSQDSIQIKLSDGGGTATLRKNDGHPLITPEARQRQADNSMPAEGLAVMREVGKRPYEKATGGFIAISIAGGIIAAPAVAASAPTVTTLGIESMTVTTSGAATDLVVVGSLENTAAFEGVQGFNVLRVPDAVYTWEGVNTVWLDSIIAQGQSVLVQAGGQFTQREIAYLLARGYTQYGTLLIP